MLFIIILIIISLFIIWIFLKASSISDKILEKKNVTNDEIKSVK